MTDPTNAEKLFRIGMYGGKFLPFHKGHAHCIDVASSECDILYVVLFYDLTETFKIEVMGPQRGFYIYLPPELKCSPERRKNSILDYIEKKDDNIKLITIHKNVFTKNGIEDWTAEADYIKETIGKDIDAVYSSEPAYSDFFAETYPKAVHRLIDPERKEVPISGTEIRSMPTEEAVKWII